ncbi:unnamed protein product [Aphanomyces euteiches]|uniref:DNA-(apurinic or apyrimidinic site) endonuclease n=1 Tax=Aphanomyces euteiches TaxID=100861 RepID=A0A6G0WHA1_9STRA|nr:hypothetical protein Ae201684_015179 [Aphanomyces euteiches]KAH9133602.1 hypothetical protein AeRB84_020383 [Aphanomyces euteiches]
MAPKRATPAAATRKSKRTKTEPAKEAEPVEDSSPVTAAAEETAPAEKKAAWGFLKAPSGAQLKKPTKKAVAAEAVEFPPLSEADLSLFDATVVPPKRESQTRIVSWNVNGIRAVLKYGSNYFRAYIAREDPDVLCLSETKIDSDALDSIKHVLPQYKHQYWKCADQKGYSGTVIFSKIEPLSVRTSLVVGKEEENEGRFIALEFSDFWLVHTYVPNAGQKLDRLSYRTESWDKTLFQELKALDATKPVIWCGDLNVAYQEIDIHDPKGNKNKSAGFTDAERESFGSLLAHGFVDSFRAKYPTEQAYTYFSYRFGARAKNKGWRLDYFVVSPSLMPRVEDSTIRKSIVGSDHLPIVLDLNLRDAA